MNSKRAFLERLYQRFPAFQRAVSSERLEGASPPSVFIGRIGYPKVSIGPLVPPQYGDTRFLDAPEQWIPAGASSQDILGFRLSLVRGMHAVGVKEKDRIVGIVQEIALSEQSPEVEAVFTKKPAGNFINEEVQPFGPSAPLKQLHVGTARLDSRLEKFYFDTDATAKTAMLELHTRDTPTSAIARALSAGCFGLEKNRRLVPTRWSITAVDSTISEQFLEEIRGSPLVEQTRVYEHESLRNRFLVILFPSHWRYEWIEAFFPGLPTERLTVFGDGEGYYKKKEYSSVGGCYYTARLAIAEKLLEEKKQAGALVLREAYEDYIPLGVFNVRENMRAALKSKPLAFEDLNAAVKYAFSRLRLLPEHWTKNSTVLKELARSRTLERQAIQTRLLVA
jgi:hypothetical protein